MTLSRVDDHEVTYREVAYLTVAGVCECGATGVSSSHEKVARLIHRKHRSGFVGPGDKFIKHPAYKNE
jgi:hypothetical protein